MSLPAVLQGNLSLPVICSPLFIISNPDLVIAQCKAGVVGSFPALNARPAEVLDEWLQRITTELADYQAANPEAKVAPFAVNQIVHGSNDRLQHDVELCVKYKVPIIITSLRAPNEVVGPIHSYGGLVFHDVINVKHAKKAIEAGVDGLILVCAGAGGHAGQLSPFALVEEVRAFWEGPLALSATDIIVPQGRVAPVLFSRADGSRQGSLKGGGGTFVVLSGEQVFHGPGNKAGWITGSDLQSRDVVATFKNANAMVIDGAHSFLLTSQELVNLRLFLHV